METQSVKDFASEEDIGKLASERAESTPRQILSGTEPRWTSEERQILGLTARTEGWEWTNRHAREILEEAREFGTLSLEHNRAAV